ncbi:hypothetical protein J6590_015936 [Homalodisca vitripennis]|nr:hypothetical protein J6590_015936 [Homalodisca vitripennis]
MLPEKQIDRQPASSGGGRNGRSKICLLRLLCRSVKGKLRVVPEQNLHSSILAGTATGISSYSTQTGELNFTFKYQTTTVTAECVFVCCHRPNNATSFLI